jgi:hypothetical protein
MTEDRGQRIEDRGLRTDDGGQMTEDRVGPSNCQLPTIN